MEWVGLKISKARLTRNVGLITALEMWEQRGWDKGLADGQVRRRDKEWYIRR